MKILYRTLVHIILEEMKQEKNFFNEIDIIQKTQKFI